MNVIYAIAGRRILIETQDDWATDAVSHLLSRWFVSRLPANGSVPPDATVRIKVGTNPPPIPAGLFTFSVPEGGICHTDSHTFYLDFNGSLIVIGPGTSRIVQVWIAHRYELGSPALAQIISQAFTAALRRCELYEFHSAGVVPPSRERAALIAGPSGSGKSTLTMQLVSCGWNYLSDDTLLLNQDSLRVEVYAVRKFFALTAETMAALQLSPVAMSSETLGTKERVTPLDLFPAKQITHAQPGAIFFPTISQKAETELRKLSSAEAMTRLLRLCPWSGYDKPTAGKHLGVLGELARDCVAFDFLAGTDVLENRGLAAQFCLSSMESND